MAEVIRVTGAARMVAQRPDLFSGERLRQGRGYYGADRTHELGDDAEDIMLNPQIHSATPAIGGIRGFIRRRGQEIFG